jgi:cysteine synthase
MIHDDVLSASRHTPLVRLRRVLPPGAAEVLAKVGTAIAVARDLGAGKRIVTIAPDTGRSYLSTYFDETWRRARGL